MIRNLPLRHALPLVLLVASVPLSLLAYWLEMKEAEYRIDQQLSVTAAHVGNQISAMLYHDLGEGDMEGSQGVLKGLMTLPELNWAVLLDSRDQVMLATERSLQGVSDALPDGPPEQLVREARATLSGQVDRSAGGETVWAVYPLRLPLQAGELRSGRIGLVVLSFDTRVLRAIARHDAIGRALTGGAVLLVLASLIWLYLRWALVARIETLTSGLRYPEGKVPEVPPVVGRDELAELARHFSRLSRDLADRNAQLRAQVEQSFQFSGRTDLEGRVLDANRLALEFAGVTAADVLGRPFPETPWWSHAPALQEWLRGAIGQAARGEPVRRMVTHRAVDGTLHDVDFSLSPVRDDQGKVLWLLAEGHDVTALLEATSAARESEQRFRNLVANVPGAVYCCEVDPPWRLIYLSEGVSQVSGHQVAEFREGRVSLAALIHPEDLPRIEREVAEAVAAGQPFELEYRIRDVAGRDRWVSERGRAVYEDDQPIYLDGLIIDVTERKEDEEHIHRLSALYATLSRTNAAIVRCGSEAELLPLICRVAAEHDGLRGVWIGMVEAQSGWLRIVANEGLDDDYVERLHISVNPEVPEGRGPTGSAIREGRRLVCNDFLNDPTTAPWHERADAAGYRASAAFPLRRGGRVVGAISFYAGAVGFFTDEVVTLLAEMAHDISFALDNYTRQEELLMAETVFDNSREMIIVTDPETRILKVNRAFSEISGYSLEDVAGKPVRLLKSGRHEASFYARMWDAINSVGYWQGEVWNRAKSGEIYPAWASISAVRGPAGEVVKYISVATDITEHKQAEDRIRYLAYYDPLTDLPNRTLLRDRAEQVLRASARNHREAALLFLDVDHFKTINDSLGHIAGDRLLQEVATRIRAELRQSDVVGRLGGDEFLILLPETGADEAAHVAQHLLANLGRPYPGEQHDLNVTASIGIVLYPRDGHDFGDLHKNADIAMYKAKELGRNRTQFFTPELNHAVTERLRLENALRGALANGELSLHYQPQVTIGAGAVVGVEALLRWNHPELGAISPVRFIPIAEDSGLIEPIGAWVLAEACRQCVAWRAAGLPQLRVAVNVSARQFSSTGLFDAVTAALGGSGLEARWLELEITESLLAHDLDRVLDQLHRLKGLGVSIAVDDFGTGYSSLAYLKRFPLDKLKIDQSFVRDLVADADDRAISAAVVNLGHTLGMTVIAEGVETEAHLEILRGFGCDAAQGYLFSRPQPPAELAAWLESRTAG